MLSIEDQRFYDHSGVDVVRRSDDGQRLTAEENLNRAIDDAEAKSSKPGEESLSEIYTFDPSTAEEEEL